jgi:hypothetical protein
LHHQLASADAPSLPRPSPSTSNTSLSRRTRGRPGLRRFFGPSRAVSGTQHGPSSSKG